MTKHRHTGTRKLTSMDADRPNDPAVLELPPVPPVANSLLLILVGEYHEA